MKPFTKKSLGFLSLSVALLASGQAMAITCTPLIIGNWSVGGTWVGGVPPVSGDSAVVAE